MGMSNREINRIIALNNEEMRLHLQKSDAYRQAQMAHKLGQIKKYPCWTCGDENTVMHHVDYLRPLDVTWLCRKCHSRLHRETKKWISPQ